MRLIQCGCHVVFEALVASALGAFAVQEILNLVSAHRVGIEELHVGNDEAGVEVILLRKRELAVFGGIDLHLFGDDRAANDHQQYDHHSRNQTYQQSLDFPHGRIPAMQPA